MSICLKTLAIAIVSSISLMASGCQKMNMHPPPREDLYYSVPDHIPELEQKIPIQNVD